VVHLDFLVPVERITAAADGFDVADAAVDRESGWTVFGPDGHSAQEYQTEGQDEYDADDEPGQRVPIGAECQLRRPLNHDHGYVRPGTARPVLQLARVTAGVLRVHRHDGQVGVPALRDRHAAAARLARH